jgi:hypothetical protein
MHGIGIGDVSRERGVCASYSACLCDLEQCILNAWALGDICVQNEEMKVYSQGWANTKGPRFGDGGSFCASDWSDKCKGNLTTAAETEFETRRQRDRVTLPPPPTNLHLTRRSQSSNYYGVIVC